MRPAYVVWEKDEKTIMCACKDGWKKWPQGRCILVFKNAGHLAAFIKAQGRKGRKVRAVLVGHGPYLTQPMQAEEEADEPEEYYQQKAKAFTAAAKPIQAPF